MSMSRKKEFEDRYESGTTPWELNRPDVHLLRLVEAHRVRPCKALEIGCGTGSNAIFLAAEGFEVTAVDFSDLAIGRAKEKACEQKVDIRFEVSDFLSRKKGLPEFEFVFDRGCFHSFPEKKERKRFARNAANCLKPGGRWFSILGNADDPPREEGPPMRSALDIVTAVEPFFEVLSLVSDRFDSNRQRQVRCWLCLMQKREEFKGEK